MNSRHKHNSTLIQIYFHLLDIEEHIHTNSFPIEEIEKEIKKIKDIIKEQIEE
jgi:hypothetical protein